MRVSFRLLGSAFTLLLAGLSAAPDSAPAMFRRTPGHQANYNEPPILSRPEVRWQAALAGEVFSTPVAVDGLIYVGSNHNRFYALDAATGRIVWEAGTLGGANSSPAVADGIVYFNDLSGRFHALDARTGARRWLHEVHGERIYGTHGYGTPERRGRYQTDLWDPTLSSPVIIGDLVCYASGNGTVYALDRATGAEKWSFATDDVIHCAPAVAGGRLYVGGWDGFFYCLDAATGAEHWRLKTGSEPENHSQHGILSAPVVDGDTVYFGCRDAHFYAVNTADGTVRWKRAHNGSWVIASPVILGDLVCYPTSDSLQFLALDKHTGETRHELKTRAWSFCSPTAAGPLVYFGTFAGDLNAFDTRTGRLLWTWQTDAARRNAQGFLDAAGAFDINAKVFANWTWAESVRATRQMYSAGAIIGSPVPHDGGLLVPTTEGLLYFLR